MGRRERTALAADAAAQNEADHQRWADDGGFTPDPEAAGFGASVAALTRFPWAAVGVAAALGFALGWFTGRR